MGLAFWPGGTVEDWGSVYNSTKNTFGLHPCNTTGTYLETGVTPAAYLVSLIIEYSTWPLLQRASDNSGHKELLTKRVYSIHSTAFCTSAVPMSSQPSKHSFMVRITSQLIAE